MPCRRPYQWEMMPVFTILLATVLAVGAERAVTPPILHPFGVRNLEVVSNGELGLAVWDGGAARICNGQVLDPSGITVPRLSTAVEDGEDFLLFSSEGRSLVVTRLSSSGVVSAPRSVQGIVLPYEVPLKVARTADSFLIVWSVYPLTHALVLDSNFNTRKMVEVPYGSTVDAASNGRNFVLIFARGLSWVASVAISAAGDASETRFYGYEYASIDRVSVASDGSGYLATWTAGRNLQALILDERGEPVGTRTLAENVGVPTDVAWDGSAYGVLWQGYDSNRLFIGRFSTLAEIMTPARQVNTFGMATYKRTIAFVGDHFLICWTEGDGGIPRIARVESPSLETTQAPVLRHVLPSQRFVRVARGESTYGAVWTEFDTHLRFARLTDDGISLDGGGILLGGSLAGYAVAYRDGAYIVVWSDSVLHIAIIPEAGESLEVRRVEPRIPGDAPAIAVSPESAVLVWEERTTGAVHAAELSNDGQLSDAFQIEPSSSLRHMAPRIVWTGTHYLLSYSLSECAYGYCSSGMKGKMAALDVDARPVGEPFETGFSRTLAMTFGSGKVLTVEDSDGALLILRSPDGTAISDPIPIDTTGAPTNIAPFGEGFLVCWASRPSVVELMSVSHNGVLLSSAIISERGESPALLASDSRAGIVYTASDRLVVRALGVARRRPVH